MKKNDVANSENRVLRIAVVSTEPELYAQFHSVLEQNNLEISQNLFLHENVLAEIEQNNIDVILVNLDDDSEKLLDTLEELAEHSVLPVLFNDSATTQFQQTSRSDSAWARKLAGKLRKLAEASTSNKFEQAATEVPTGSESVITTPLPAAAQVTFSSPGDLWPICVIGASLGGPIALRDFFAQLDREMPVSFLIAQHIGPSHLELFAQQLNRGSRVEVRLAEDGDELRPNTALVVPVERGIEFDESGKMHFIPPPAQCVYTPCIDAVIAETSARFTDRVNVIIFSGMGNDGEKGCKVAAASGGRIWAQEATSCVISSMPDSVRHTGGVSFEGNPAQLAGKLIETYCL